MYRVAKFNKRLWIVDEVTDQTIYCPPDFVKVNSRDDLKKSMRKV
jgi:hypothetical protein